MHAFKNVLMQLDDNHARRLMDVTGLTLPTVRTHTTPTSHTINLDKGFSRRERQKAEAISASIEAMTDDLGYQALVAEAVKAGKGRFHPNRYHLAVELFEQDEEAFRRAEHIRYASYYRDGRFWDNFRVPLPAVFSDKTSMDSFLSGLKGFFDLEDIDDDELLIDVFPVFGEEGEIEQWQVMVYRDGIPKHYRQLDRGKGKVRGGVYRPVQEYALVYHEDDQRLEVISSHRSDREEMASLFARTALGVNAPLLPITPANLNLDLFLDRPALDVSDELPIEEEIEWVAVSSMTLRSATTPGEFVIKPDVRKVGETDCYKFLAMNDIPFLVRQGNFQIKKVKLSIRFRASDDGTRPAEPVHLELTAPNKCSLKAHSIRENYIRKVLLAKWKIFVDEQVKEA